MLGVIPGGVLIAGGCALYLYARLKYVPTVSKFEDFGQLKHHLGACDNLTDRCVIVEGTVNKLAENSVHSKNAGIEGAARKVLSTIQGKTSTVSDISVPFLLVDPNGQSIRVTTIHRALRISLVMENVWEEKSGTPIVPTTQELMLTFGTRLGIFGCATLSSDEIVLTPKEVDKSLAVTAASCKSRRYLLYAGSCLLILSGCVVIFNFNFTNPF